MMADRDGPAVNQNPNPNQNTNQNPNQVLDDDDDQGQNPPPNDPFNPIPPQNPFYLMLL